ncbi:MAG: hypothetical protein MR449_04065 [Spirochaetia bacterium]|nr:hypothetical protein [Spirochaetia bacterium]
MNKAKLIFSVAVLFTAASLFSCASSKKTDDPQSNAEEKAPAKKKLTKEEKAALKERERQKKDSYTGWVYIPEKDFAITKDDIKIVMNGKTGAFGLYAIPEKGNPVPLISNFDDYSSTFFSVMVGKKEYRLNRENGVKSEARRTPYGAQMAYTISNQAQIVVDFSFLPSIATSTRVDMLRVTVYTINLGKKTESFALKAVFDTVLGENTTTHFSTAAHSRINSEMQFLSMDDELWIRSSNEFAAIQFLFNGKGITSPNYVTLANKDTLALPNWIPYAQENKSFSSVISYNNSALGVNWKSVYLDPMKTDVTTFYISVAIDSNEPAGRKFIQALAEGKTALSPRLPEQKVTTTVPPEPSQVDSSSLDTPYRTNMPVVPEESDVPQSSYVPEKIPSQIETPVPVTPEQLDMKYIQRLLDHIAELENNEDNVNREEIRALNAELDSILMILSTME